MSTQASASNVGQRAAKLRPKCPLQTVRISARLTPAAAAAKPPELSWGEFIPRLLRSRRNRNLYDIELTRYAAWAAVSLDRLALVALQNFGDEATGSLEQRINRLASVAALTQEIAAVRIKMEGIGHAN